MTITAGVLAGMFLFTSCNKDDDNDEVVDPGMMRTATYEYEFNNGQVGAGTEYNGMHMDNLMATMKIEEKSGDMVKITVMIDNAIDGKMYMVHAHDAADPSTTPNGTPYNETPNTDVFTQMADGNGGTITLSQMVNMSYESITSNYEGFFVIHDPLQDLSTTDLSTYLVVGSFAREQAATNYEMATYNYDFNTGQLAPSFAYMGSHPMDLKAMVKLQETAGGTRVTAVLMNAVNGETYMVHAHDKAHPNTTPNGTPYNESPNSDVCTLMLMANGGMAHNSQLSSMTFMELTMQYEAFFVVHDPMQAIDTTDPTTYVILGEFARS